MKKITFGFFTAIAVFVLLVSCHENLADREAGNLHHQQFSEPSDNAFKKKEKCPVCHFQEDEGTYKKLLVNCGKAVEAHLKHGDGLIGEEVPTDPGYIFGDNCELVELMGECPCFNAGNLNSLLAGRVDLCDHADLYGFFSRIGSAKQNILDEFCQFGGNPAATTNGAQRNDCLRLLRDAIDAYRNTSPGNIIESATACGVMGL